MSFLLKFMFNKKRVNHKKIIFEYNRISNWQKNMYIKMYNKFTCNF